MDGFRKTKDTDVVDSCSPTLDFTWFDKVVLVWSAVMVFVDICLDAVLVYKHFVAGNTAYFVCTLIFILLPSWIITWISLRWYIVQSRYGLYKEYRMKLWVTVMCHVFQLSVAYRSFSSLFYGLRSQDTKRPPEQRRVYYRLMLWEDNDASILRLIEAFLEAVPQVLLQAYIVNTRQQSPSTELVQKMSIVFGTLSAAWAIVSYVRTVRFTRENSPNISWLATTFCFLWRVLVLMPRFTALTLFAVRFTWILFPVCTCHWLLMFTWLLSTQHVGQFQQRKDRYLFKAALAGIYIFCMVDMSPGSRRCRYAIFYCVTFLENALLLGLWFLFTQVKPWYTTLALVGSFCSFCVGIIFMMVYYVWMHPSMSVVYPVASSALEAPKTHSNSGNGQLVEEKDETPVQGYKETRV
ncbi:XK-related protein 6-like isoform X1 [Ornithodoros turicata]|uniref:XK-related protein 6-like isoform X1 n=1 Tax=Ornithodoros turicata TaxID=34597 RepID=UPI00313A3BF4